jgi:COP9 signalosome complex subunit 6
MLSNRTQILLAYLQGVQSNTLRRDPEVLRLISGLMAGLPVEDPEEGVFREEFETEYADVQLTSYLSTLTKTLHSLNNVRFLALPFP